MSLVSARLSITGIVQGVGYRDFCRRRANECNLTGWVRNLPDGSVEALVEGEKVDCLALIEKLKAGPPASRVKEIAVDWRESSGKYTGFDITY